MASTGATLTNTIDLLQDKYTARFRSQTHDRTRIWNELPKGQGAFDGQRIVGLAVTGYPATGGGRGPGATLPIVGKTTLDQYQILQAFEYWPVGVDWDIQEMSRSTGAWIRAMLLQMERVRRFVSKDLERQVCGNGFGSLGEIAATPAGSGTQSYFELTNRYDAANFELGMLVEAWSGETRGAAKRPQAGSTSYTEATCWRVSAIDPNLGYIYLEDSDGNAVDLTSDNESSPSESPLASPTGWRDGDKVTKYAARTSTDTREIIGIDAIINDGGLGIDIDHPVSNTSTDFQGISPTDNTWWQCQVVDGSGYYLTPDLIQTGFTALEIFAADPIDEIMCIWAHPTQIRKYAEAIRDTNMLVTSPESVSSNVRFPVTPGMDQPHLAAGWQGATRERGRRLTYAGVPLIGSRYFRKDVAYIAHRMCVQKYILSDFHFVAGGGGSIIHKDYDRRAAYEAEALFYGNCGTDCRNSSVRIEGLTAVTT